MSADNGIYILSTIRKMKEDRPGEWQKCEPYRVYRVAHAQAIDNFDWYSEKEPHNLGAYMKEVWGRSEVFTDRDAAHKRAVEILEEIYSENLPVEYGIQFIDTDLVFYGDM